MKEIINSFSKIIRNNKKIIENYFFMTLLLVLNSYFTLLIYPYLIKVLGKDSYGIYIYGFTIASFFTTFVSFGFDMTGVRSISKFPHSIRYKSIIFSRIFTAKLYLELISVCLFSILVYIIPLWRDNSSVYWFCFSNTLVNIFLPIWYFQGIQKMKIITIIQLILKIVSLPFIFSYVKESSDILIYTIISSTVSIIGSFISFVYIIKVDRVKLSIVPIKQVVESFLQASYFFYSNLGNTIKLQSLNLIIGSHFSMSDLAIYDLAQKIISIPTIILMNVNRAIFPKIMRDTFEIDKIVKLLKYENFIGLIIIMFIIIFGKAFVLFLGGEEMLLAYPITIILSFTVYALLITTCHLDLIITPLKLDSYIFKNQIIAVTSLFFIVFVGLFFTENIFIIPIALVISAFSEIVYQKYIFYKRKIFN